MGQDVSASSSISIDDLVLKVIDHFTYLGSTITNNLLLGMEIDIHISKVAAVIVKLNKRVWNNSQLTLCTKLKVFQTCVLSTLLYGSETWTIYVRQENHLESFHLCCLRHIHDITAVLEQASSLLSTLALMSGSCALNEWWL